MRGGIQVKGRRRKGNAKTRNAGRGETKEKEGKDQDLDWGSRGKPQTLPSFLTSLPSFYQSLPSSFHLSSLSSLSLSSIFPFPLLQLPSSLPYNSTLPSPPTSPSLPSNAPSSPSISPLRSPRLPPSPFYNFSIIPLFPLPLSN